MKLIKLTTNGRVTIPAKLGKKYGLTPGKKIKFELEEDGILIIPLATPKEIENNIGFLGTNRKFLNALIIEKNNERKL